jgi:O-antigen/teichoic acid export membrane protein
MSVFATPTVGQLRIFLTGRNVFHARAWRSFLTQANPDRGRERYRRAGLTATVALVSQGLAMIISLASVPLTAGYLGRERYGVWLTISSLLSWMAMSDFGLAGPALVSLVGEANGKDDRELARDYVASAFWALLAITSLVSVIFGVAFSRIPWRAIFHVSGDISTQELHLTCALAVASFVVVLPLNMVSSIYSGYQDGFVASIWAIASNTLSLASLVAVTHYRGGLPLLILAVSATRFLVALANGIYLFAWRYPWLRPKPSAVRWSRIKYLFSLGSNYMISQVAGLGIHQSQSMIITQMLGPSQVPMFVIAQKIVTFASSLMYTAMSPLIPAYSEAAARADWAWIKATLKRAIIVSFAIGAPLTGIAAVAARPLIRWWMGAALVPSHFLVFWLGIYTLTCVMVFSPGNVLVALGRMGVLAVSVTLCAVATIALGIQFAHWWGVTGIAFAMSMAALLVMGGSQFYMAHRMLNTRLLDTFEAESVPEPVISA